MQYHFSTFYPIPPVDPSSDPWPTKILPFLSLETGDIVTVTLSMSQTPPPGDFYTQDYYVGADAGIWLDPTPAWPIGFEFNSVTSTGSTPITEEIDWLAAAPGEPFSYHVYFATDTSPRTWVINVPPDESNQLGIRIVYGDRYWSVAKLDVTIDNPDRTAPPPPPPHFTKEAKDALAKDAATLSKLSRAYSMGDSVVASSNPLHGPLKAATWAMEDATKSIAKDVGFEEAIGSFVNSAVGVVQKGTGTTVNPISFTLSLTSLFAKAGNLVMTALANDPPDGNFTEVYATQSLNLTVPDGSAVDNALLKDTYDLLQDNLAMLAAVERYQGAELAGDTASEDKQAAAFDNANAQYAVDRLAVGADVDGFVAELKAAGVPDAAFDGSDLTEAQDYLASIGTADPFLTELQTELATLIGTDAAATDVQAVIDALQAATAPVLGGTVFSTLADAGAALSVQAGATVRDFDADGKSDLLWQHGDGSTAIWLMDGLTATNSGVVAVPPPEWHARATGDLNGDGKADILWQNDDGSVAAWLIDGLTTTDSAVIAVPPPSWQVVGTGDFDGDTKSDILWQNTDGSVAIWEMDGLTPTAEAVVATPDPSWKVIGTGDFDGDGQSDILWQNTNGDAAIWEMNGLNLLDSAVVATPGTSWQVIGAGDFDGDGKSDILWQNTDGTTAIWGMNGLTPTFTDVVGIPPASWHVKGPADLNGDSKSDILWQNDDGSVAGWLMDGSTVLDTAVIATPGASWQLIKS